MALSCGFRTDKALKKPYPPPDCQGFRIAARRPAQVQSARAHRATACGIAPVLRFPVSSSQKRRVFLGLRRIFPGYAAGRIMRKSQDAVCGQVTQGNRIKGFLVAPPPYETVSPKKSEVARIFVRPGRHVSGAPDAF